MMNRHPPSQWIFVLLLTYLWALITPVSPARGEGTSREDRILEEKSKVHEAGSKFINLPPMYVPVIRSNTPVGYISMRIILEANTIPEAEYLANQYLKVHDTIYQNIYVICDTIWNTSYNPSLASVKKRVDAICAKLIGKDLVKDVLVENVKMYRIR